MATTPLSAVLHKRWRIELILPELYHEIEFHGILLVGGPSS